MKESLSPSQASLLAEMDVATLKPASEAYSAALKRAHAAEDAGRLVGRSLPDSAFDDLSNEYTNAYQEADNTKPKMLVSEYAATEHYRQNPDAYREAAIADAQRDGKEILAGTDEIGRQLVEAERENHMIMELPPLQLPPSPDPVVQRH